MCPPRGQLLLLCGWFGNISLWPLSPSRPSHPSHPAQADSARSKCITLFQTKKKPFQQMPNFLRFFAAFSGCHFLPLFVVLPPSTLPLCCLFACITYDDALRQQFQQMTKGPTRWSGNQSVHSGAITLSRWGKVINNSFWNAVRLKWSRDCQFWVLNNCGKFDYSCCSNGNWFSYGIGNKYNNLITFIVYIR